MKTYTQLIEELGLDEMLSTNLMIFQGMKNKVGGVGGGGGGDKKPSKIKILAKKITDKLARGARPKGRNEENTQHRNKRSINMQEAVYEYFNNYFDGTLNESTSDEDIMDAVYDLVYLTEAVTEAVLDEVVTKKRVKLLRKAAARRGEQLSGATKTLGKLEKLKSKHYSGISQKMKDKMDDAIHRTKMDVNELGARKASLKLGAETRNLARQYGI
jgi:hypothetical protein